jgi:hypothetical protein
MTVVYMGCLHRGFTPAVPLPLLTLSTAALGSHTMRLVNTTTLKLEEFDCPKVPPYAIPCTHEPRTRCCSKIPQLPTGRLGKRRVAQKSTRPANELGFPNQSWTTVGSAHVGSAHVGSAHVGSAHVGSTKRSTLSLVRPLIRCKHALYHIVITATL